MRDTAALAVNGNGVVGDVVDHVGLVELDDDVRIGRTGTYAARRSCKTGVAIVEQAELEGARLPPRRACFGVKL